MINEMNGINESDTWHDAIAVFTEEPASSTEMARPNIFRIAGFPRRETVSSNVLAYFFDPAEGHGLKDMMLKALLRTIHKEDMDVSDVSVATEASTDKNNRIDILLDLPELSIAIENKVDAGLYNDLADYHCWARENSVNDKAIVVVLHPFSAARGAHVLAVAQFNGAVDVEENVVHSGQRIVVAGVVHVERAHISLCVHC